GGPVAETAAAESRGIEEAIDASEFRKTLRQHRGGGLRTRQVADPAFGARLRGEFPGGLFIGRRQNEMSSTDRGDACGRGGDAARTGDDERFVLEVGQISI